MDQEFEAGLADLTSRLARAKLKIVEKRRPWTDRSATYLVIGTDERNSTIVLTDEFLSDLPTTRDYQISVDRYAETIASRIRCGPASVFYCKSESVIRVDIDWPVRSAIFQSRFRVHVLIDVTDVRSGALAKCAVEMDRIGPYHGTTPFDEIKSVVNRARTAIDRGLISFYKPKEHPTRYQSIEPDTVDAKPESSPEIERFIAGKTYWLGFRVPPVPNETWVADPWDADYLSVSAKDLAQQASILRARRLIELDSTLAYARPSDKLLTEGWPAAMESIVASEQPAKVTLANLQKKDDMLASVKALLEKVSDLAVIVIDLDHFKEVNDNLGHVEGDVCLERIVMVLDNILRGRASFYRWGGDEFAIVLPSVSTQEATATAERIRREIEQAKAGGTVGVTASIGLCGLDQTEERSAEGILNMADKAMYASKQSGKNRVTCWPIESVRSITSEV